MTLALPQDVQGESYDYPEQFLQKRVHHFDRRPLTEAALRRAADLIAASKRPMMICGGGVRYSEAGDLFGTFASTFAIPFGETQAGKGTLPWDHVCNLGGIGVTGAESANLIARDADLLIAVGTRMGDFTTASKWAFQNPNLKVLGINVGSFDAMKMNGEPFLADARAALAQLTAELAKRKYHSAYKDEISAAARRWKAEVDRLYAEEDPAGLGQVRVLGELNERFLDPEDIVVSASGSLPGDMQRVWRARARESYHMEYGFSCMGYEINAAVGAKLAAPDREVYSLVGDGGYVMLHSELLTAVQDGTKIIVLVFDNNGFQVIDNLQTNQGISSYGNEWRKRDAKSGRLTGDYLKLDFAKHAEAYGAAGFSVRTLEELRAALKAAKSVSGPVVIDIKVTQKSMTHGYESWWRVGVPEVSASKSVLGARKDLDSHLGAVRKY